MGELNEKDLEILLSVFSLHRNISLNNYSCLRQSGSKEGFTIKPRAEIQISSSDRETSNMLTTSLCLLSVSALAVRGDLSYGSYSSPYDFSNYSAYSLTPSVSSAASRTRRVFGAFTSDNPFCQWNTVASPPDNYIDLFQR